MIFKRVGPPAADEYFSYYGGYVALVGNGDLLQTMYLRLKEAESFYASIDAAKSLGRYAAHKWSIREVLGHIIDTERIMSYRALSFARGDHNALPGVDQDDFMRNSNFDERDWSGMIAEFVLMRRANILMFDNLPDDAWNRRGVASEHEITVRALGYIVAGHEIHHSRVVADRYLQT